MCFEKEPVITSGGQVVHYTCPYTKEIIMVNNTINFSIPSAVQEGFVFNSNDYDYYMVFFYYDMAGSTYAGDHCPGAEPWNPGAIIYIDVTKL
jgi:hypothetical protein